MVRSQTQGCHCRQIYVHVLVLYDLSSEGMRSVTLPYLLAFIIRPKSMTPRLAPYSDFYLFYSARGVPRTLPQVNVKLLTASACNLRNTSPLAA
jgi:hypothetical protein